MKCHFSHKFEARYSYNFDPLEYVLAVKQSVGSGDGPFTAADALIANKKYIYDVCIKCGEIVKDEIK